MKAESKDVRSQGVHVLKSFLTSLEIPFSVTEENVLSVASQDGKQVRVNVSLTGYAPVTNEVQLIAEDIVAPDVDRIYGQLHKVTVAAGYGKPAPTERGSTPAGKISYKDDYELVYLRHGLLRRTPNPKDVKALDIYMPIIKRCANKAVYKFRNVLIPMGFDADDLINIGRLHTLTFLHNYAYEKAEEDNRKLLSEFLNQRFGELAKVTFKKAASATCLPQSVVSNNVSSEDDEDGFDLYLKFASDDSVAADSDYEDEFFNIVFEDGGKGELRVVNDGRMGILMYLDGALLTKTQVEDFREDYNLGKISMIPVTEEIEVKVPEVSEAARRQKAKDELYQKLNAMSDEDRKQALAYAAMSRDYAPEARELARKLCDEQLCPKCKKRVPSGKFCTNCGDEAQSHYGINYLKYREELKQNGDSLAEAMTAPLSDTIQRNIRAKQTTPEVTSFNVQEHKALVEKLRKECFDALPEMRTCPGRCGETKHKSNFGVRVPLRKSDGKPGKASVMPYCNRCRKPEPKKRRKL